MARSSARAELLDSSADPEPGSDGVPFRERIRPGMVVCWDPAAAAGGEYAGFAVGGRGYGMVMCPANAVGGRVKDVKGVVVNPEGHAVEGEAYLCALVLPALLPGSYGISPWRQVVVRVGEMEAEVLMEWDEATRYYYMTV